MKFADLGRSLRALCACGLIMAGATAEGYDDPTFPWCAGIPLPHGTVAADGSACRPLDVRAPNALLHLAVAATEAQREHGLMGVAAVPARQGMLFAFPDATNQTRDFWMKNTITPLDMVFVTDGGKITSIAANVPATAPGTPDDKVARRSGVGRYVIELGAGAAAQDGLAPGVRLAIPPITAQ
jgi:uncharacterized membrane protein (UPF0127 family)